MAVLQVWRSLTIHGHLILLTINCTILQFWNQCLGAYKRTRNATFLIKEAKMWFGWRYILLMKWPLVNRASSNSNLHGNVRCTVITLHCFFKMKKNEKNQKWDFDIKTHLLLSYQNRSAVTYSVLAVSNMHSFTLFQIISNQCISYDDRFLQY